MAISLTKEKMEELFLQYLATIFGFPEVVSCCAKEVVITRETLGDAGKQAFESGFHDLYSDIDLSVKVRLPKNGSVTPEEYNKRIDRFGVTEDTALGWMYIPVNHIYRIIFKNGMRYDLIFEFEYTDDVELNLEKQFPSEKYVRAIGEGATESTAKKSALAELSAYFSQTIIAESESIRTEETSSEKGGAK